MRRNILTIGTALMAILLAAACSSTSTGSPSATTTDSLTPNLYGAPHVATALDTAKFQSNPCSSITSAQLATLDIGTSTRVATGGVGPTCNWAANGDGTKSTATIGYLTSGAGLSSIYSTKSSYAVFTVLPDIDGYPAVSALTVDERSSGTCDISVGVSDSLAVDISLSVASGQYKSDPCTPNQQLAADVISNIKNGG